MLPTYRSFLPRRLHQSLLGITGAALLSVSTQALALLPFENDGDLYVSMWFADAYNIFDKSGSLQGNITANTFDASQTAPADQRVGADPRVIGLNGPRGLAFNPLNGDLWVTSEHADRIFILDKQHRVKSSFTHPDFNEPVGISFRMDPDIAAENQEVYISNSGNASVDPDKGNNIMVFNQQGELLRSFTRDGLVDPNCTAFFPDGSFYVSNRLGTLDDDGNADGNVGRVDKYDADDNFLFSFTTDGIVSLMAVARDPNGEGDADDTIWATSGGGSRGIYEYDQQGTLLKTILPDDLADFGVNGADIVPQGIAFDDQGNMTVASFSGGVYQFDGDGNLQNSYQSGSGNSRSIAFAYEIPEETDQNTDTDTPTTGGGGNGSTNPFGIILLAIGIAVRRFKNMSEKRQ